MAEGSGNFSGRKLPSTLGNVALWVSGYSFDNGVSSVSGLNLKTRDPLTVQLMTPARAASLMKGRDPGDDRQRALAWEERFANRRELSTFADPANRYGVKVNGVLLLNNTRLDFNDKNYYAQTAFGFVNDPTQQAVLTGTIALSKFDDGSFRLQIYRPQDTALLSASAVDVSQRHVRDAFKSGSPVGGGAMARSAIVTVIGKVHEDGPQTQTLYLRSANIAVNAGENVSYQLTNGFGDTLMRGQLDGHAAAAAAAVAASTRVPLETVIGRVSSDTSRDDRERVSQIYDAVAQGRVTVALTPGYTIPIVRSALDGIAKRQELFQSGSFDGAVAVVHRGANGEGLERPAAFNIASFSVLPKTAPENVPTPAKAAMKAHEALATLGDRPKEDAEQQQGRKSFSPPGFQY